MHIDILDKKSPHSFRKLSMASWKPPVDPSIYMALDINVFAVQRYLAFINKENNGTKVTLLHFTAKVLCRLFRTYPNLNVTMIGNTIYHRRHIGLFFQTIFPSSHGWDLSGFELRDLDTLPLTEIARHHRSHSRSIRSMSDKPIRRVVKLTSILPQWLLNMTIAILDTLYYKFNISLSFLGLPKDRFSSAMLSDLSPFGVASAYVPLFPFSRCPFSLSLGNIVEKVIAIDGEITMAPIVTLSFTVDHRYFDGVDAKYALRFLKEAFKEPEKFDA